MRKLILITAILCSGILAQAQVEFKGIELGETWTGNELSFKILDSSILGAVRVNQLDDGRVWQVVVIPYYIMPEEEPRKITAEEIDALKSYVENEYGVTLMKRTFDDPNSSKENWYWLEALDEGKDVSYQFLVQYEDKKASKADFTFFITNNDLQEVAEREEQVVADNNFSKYQNSYVIYVNESVYSDKSRNILKKPSLRTF